ncbi:hypothetical protein EIP91_012192 [Steccherinum ochraceum]|uniref:Uncharacterized protein n=1 Tax=Steccherinum ochraceum TaxID=92696 RepID=A0A4V2MWU9_9APHY|nr:hypothetical protein EIP91_012192 [Steccherinum ochraceum]
MASSSKTSGAYFKTLHVPGNPVILANIWDVPSLNAVVSLNTPTSQPIRVLATASYAIAETLGKRDAELTREENLARSVELGPHAQRAGLPYTVDLQDGYGDKLEESVRAVVEGGAAGANVEDAIPAVNWTSLIPIDVQVERLKRVLAAAKEAGEPDFVLNARSDIFMMKEPNFKGDLLEEAIKRGKAYLAAGATTVFYWGAGLTVDKVKTLVKELDGKVSVMLSGWEGKLTPRQIGSELGVARVSVGPKLWLAGGKDAKKIKAAAAELFV